MPAPATPHWRIGCSLANRLLIPLLFESIDRQSAEQLGVEVGRFLRHNFARKGNVTDLRHATRIHQKSDIGARAAGVPYLRQSFARVADVRNILLVADGFLRKVQHSLQQTLMQLHHIEGLLAERQASENLRRGARIGMVKQEGSVGGDGEDGSSSPA